MRATYFAALFISDVFYICIIKKINMAYNEFDLETLLKCKGFLPKFINGLDSIDLLKPLNTLNKKQLPKVDGVKNGVINYTNYSVVYNSERRGAFYAAYNIDEPKMDLPKSRPTFKKDLRLDVKHQLGLLDFYKLDTREHPLFEVGHLCSNNELCWGDNFLMQTKQTFFFTNAIPQTERLNVGLWRGLESFIVENTRSSTNNNKICVFTGPIYKKTDIVLEEFNNYKLPLMFFKVIVFEYKKKLYSTAFIISHEKKIIEEGFLKTTRGRESMTVDVMPFSDYKYRKVFQVDMSLLNKETGHKFIWKNVKPIAIPNDKNQIKKIRNVGDADDAKDEIKALRNGVINKGLSTTESISEKEITSKSFHTNIVLPM